MRTLDLSTPGDFEGEYLESIRRQDGCDVLALRAPDGERVRVMVHATMRGIVEALNEARNSALRCNSAFRARVVLRSHGRRELPKGKRGVCIVDWAVGRYDKNEPPPQWDWTRFE